MRKLLVIPVRKISLLTGRDLYQTQADFGVQVVEGLGEREGKSRAQRPQNNKQDKTQAAWELTLISGS